MITTSTFPTSSAPARPRLSTITVATLTSAAALAALVALGSTTGHLLLVPPMAASMALIAGAPALPLSQPRSVIGGQLISAGVGLLVGTVSHTLIAAAIAGALALGAMLAARTSHSPAAATAVIGALTTSGQLSFLICAGLAAVILVAAGLARSRLGGADYPTYWW
ncbi:HPP family protein [Cellulomonas sp. NPDC089187]|uniref:HPP family protein n=1 Tax=Cellulomonas sp. NPDC089187 TaxID=3154970 RepID=UPI0034485C59